MRDPLWLVGVAMTPFGRFPDRDLLDLASDTALGALDDAGVSMADVGVLAAGTVFHANASVGQQLLKQIGQIEMPVYNVANACATGATALRTACLSIWAGDRRRLLPQHDPHVQPHRRRCRGRGDRFRGPAPRAPGRPEEARREGVAEQFVDEIALGPGMWAQLPLEMRQMFIRHTPRFLGELKDPDALSIDLDALAAVWIPVLLSQGDQSPPMFAPIIRRLADTVPPRRPHTFSGAGHVPRLTHPSSTSTRSTTFWSRPNH